MDFSYLNAVIKSSTFPAYDLVRGWFHKLLLLWAGAGRFADQTAWHRAGCCL